MRYFPTAPLEFARPFGICSDFELSRICVEPIVEAQRKMIRAGIVSFSPVFASITRTPVARFASASKSMPSTTASVRTVSRPVASAAGSVELCVLKYEPVEHPMWHGPQ